MFKFKKVITNKTIVAGEEDSGAEQGGSGEGSDREDVGGGEGSGGKIGGQEPRDAGKLEA